MKHKLSVLICCIMLFTAICGGCSNPNASVSKSGFYFDTIIKITLYGTNSEQYIDDCFELAHKYENLFSNTIDSSEVSQINSNAGSGSYVTVSDETLELIKEGILYGDVSNGAFDITIGKLSDLWDFSDIAENLTSEDNETDASVLPSDADIQSDLAHVNYKNIVIDGNQVMLTDPDSELDLGGIAKGYIADRMKEYLNSKGITSGIINLGGNVLTIGEKSTGAAYKVGIQKPFAKDGTSIATVDVKDKSVVSSGVYERYYKIDGKLYHHILDPKTGYPCDNDLYEVTIISDRSVDGDGLSTTCFALGLDAGMQLIESMPDTEAIFITDDYKIHTSSGIGKAIPFTELSE